MDWGYCKHHVLSTILISFVVDEVPVAGCVRYRRQLRVRSARRVHRVRRGLQEHEPEGRLDVPRQEGL